MGRAFVPETGESRFHEADSITIPYGGYPSTPIEDATVWVHDLDAPSDSWGVPAVFVSNPPTVRVFKKPGIDTREEPGRPVSPGRSWSSISVRDPPVSAAMQADAP
jgi:hypothetical protein